MLLLSGSSFIPNIVIAQSAETSLIGDPRNPHTPLRSVLEEQCTLEAFNLVRIKKSAPDGVNRYYHKGRLYSGWACSVDHNSSHRFRYSKYENGILVRQIGYYSNGKLDHDFHMSNGKNTGSERMWMADGFPYIDNYYSSPGVMDGIQKRWYPNHVLAKVSMYDDGKLVYSISYDQSGKITETTGQVP